MLKLSTQCSKVYACYVWKQWEIWLQNCKMDTKTMQCMRILNWKFFSCNRSRINWTSFESGRLKPKILIVISIDRKTSSINQKSGKIRFLKNRLLMQKHLKAHCFIKKCMSMRRKVFQKHLNSTQIFQNQDFQSICPQSANIIYILH